jgi:small GTP-binding protein
MWFWNLFHKLFHRKKNIKLETCAVKNFVVDDITEITNKQISFAKTIYESVCDIIPADKRTKLEEYYNDLNSAKFDKKLLKVGIVGNFNSGKSSLLNALFNTDFPVRNNPTTSTVTNIKHSDDKNTEITDENGNVISKNDYDKLVDLDSSDIKSRRFNFPVNALHFKGIEFSDTPGFGNADNEGKESDTTRTELKSVDVVILVFYACVGEISRSLEKEISASDKNKEDILVILNKVDQKSKSDCEEIYEGIKNRGYKNIFYFSSKPYEDQFDEKHKEWINRESIKTVFTVHHVLTDRLLLGVDKSEGFLEEFKNIFMKDIQKYLKKDLDKANEVITLLNKDLEKANGTITLLNKDLDKTNRTIATLNKIIEKKHQIGEISNSVIADYSVVEKYVKTFEIPKSEKSFVFSPYAKIVFEYGALIEFLFSKDIRLKDRINKEDFKSYIGKSIVKPSLIDDKLAIAIDIQNAQIVVKYFDNKDDAENNKSMTGYNNYNLFAALYLLERLQEKEI